MLKVVSAMAAVLFMGADAQGMGHGISKFTRGHSHPKNCLAFFENILGGSQAQDGCPNDVCECATQGRAQICESNNGPYQGHGHGKGHHGKGHGHHPHHQEDHEFFPPPPPMGSSFGIHSINCTYHPYGSQSLEDIEKKINAEVGDFKTVNQHMDSHVSIKTEDLSTYITKLENSGEYPYLRRQQKDGEKTMYGLLVQACDAYFVEILSERVSEHDTSDFIVSEIPLLHLSDDDFTASSNTDSVTKVARATTKIDEMVKFYTETIGGSLVKREKTDEGEYAIVKLTYADAQLHFINRNAPEGAKFTVADLETYVNSVHDEYVKSTNCGFDQHADHHWAYDTQTNAITLSSVSKKLEEGGHKYRWFSLPGNMHQIYAFDPSGWTFQLDLQPGNDVPSTTASYSAACKSDDGCYGQGLCNNVNGGHFVYETKGWDFFLQ